MHKCCKKKQKKNIPITVNQLRTQKELDLQIAYIHEKVNYYWEYFFLYMKGLWMQYVDTQYSNNGWFDMYAQKLLLNDTDKQGTGTSEENKFQLQNNGVRYKGVTMLICMCIRTDIWLIELWSCNSWSVLHKNTRWKISQTVYYFKRGG